MKDDDVRRIIHRAVDTRLSGVRGDPWLGRRVVSAERNGKPMIKRKMPLALIVCLILVAATVSAAALNLNVFELLAGQEPRLKDIAANSALEEAPTVTVENNKAGKSIVQVTNAYYDGEAMVLGYFVENERYLEAFEPMEDFLARMQPVDSALDPFAFAPGQEEWAERYAQAKENHTSFGLMKVNVYLKDHAKAENAVDLGPWSENGVRGENNTQYSIRDYERLPDELKNLDSLRVCLKLCQQISYVYFDGESNYTYFETREMPDVIVTVPRTQAETRRFGGEITVGGVAAQIDASISVIRASVRFTAVSEAFADIPADSDRWYEIELTDENGNVWTDEGWHWEDDRHMCFTMTGLGMLPEKLTARFRIVEEEKIIQETEVLLTMQ